MKDTHAERSAYGTEFDLGVALDWMSNVRKFGIVEANRIEDERLAEAELLRIESELS